MNRRRFSIATATALAGIPGALGAKGERNLDRFGGWKGKRFKGTGFFRVEQDERWWLVTPEGNAFLSFGINHLYPDLWRQDYNREAWQKRLGVENPPTISTRSPAAGRQDRRRAWARKELPSPRDHEILHS